MQSPKLHEETANRTSPNPRRFQRLAAPVGTIALIGGGMVVGMTSPAAADEFTLAQPPTIQLLSDDGEPWTETEVWDLEPPNNWSSGQAGLLQQEITYRVTNPAGSKKVSAITGYFAHPDANYIDPRLAIEFTLTRSVAAEAGFIVSTDSGSSKWWNVSIDEAKSTFDPRAAENQTQFDITLDLQVSPVAQAGTWRLESRAIHRDQDVSPPADSNLIEADFATVNSFGQFSTDRESWSWGQLTPNSSKTISGTAGEVITNAPHDWTLQVGDFVNDQDPDSRITNAAALGIPGQNQYQFRCVQGYGEEEEDAVETAAKVGTEATEIAQRVAGTEGTAEDGVTLRQTCRLQLGPIDVQGGLYSSVVEAGLLPSPDPEGVGGEGGGAG